MAQASILPAAPPGPAAGTVRRANAGILRGRQPMPTTRAMTAVSMSPAPVRPRAGAMSWLLLVLGAGGFAAVWILLALATNRQCSWMAVVGALDIAWMLRLGQWPRGRGRLAVSVLATALVVVAANWFITAAQLGGMLGYDPLMSALRLGPNLAWTLAQLVNSAADVAWIALALVVAGVTSR